MGASWLPSSGLEGVSSHSGRRGLASELVRRGASTTAVQAAGGWRSAAMVARYASAVAVEDGAVARLFGGSVIPSSPDRTVRSDVRCPSSTVRRAIA